MTHAAQPVVNTLFQHRLQLRLEQREVADRLAALAAGEKQAKGPIGLDAHAVSRHERGVHWPIRRHRRLYTLLYGVDEDELWPERGRARTAPDPLLAASWDHGGTVEASIALTGRGGRVQRREFMMLVGAALAAPAHQWLVQEPGRLAAAVNGDRVTPALAARLPGMIDELRRMDDAHDPAVVQSLVERELGWIAGMLDQGSYNESTGRQLHLALAEMGQIAGYMAYDRGDHVHAQRYFLTSLRAAHTAGDQLLGSHLLKCMAEQATELGRPRDALALIETALAGVRGDSAAGQSALLQSWNGRAHAALGDQRACRTAIDKAQGLVSQRAEGHDPSWLYWLSTADIVTKAGEALLHAGLPRPAEEMLLAGLAALPKDRHLGDQQVFLTRLAVAQVLNGNLEASLSTGNRALNLARLRPSQRAAGRIRELCNQLRLRASSGPVTEFLERARSTLPNCLGPHPGISGV